MGLCHFAQPLMVVTNFFRRQGLTVYHPDIGWPGNHCVGQADFESQ